MQKRDNNLIENQCVYCTKENKLNVENDRLKQFALELGVCYLILVTLREIFT